MKLSKKAFAAWLSRHKRQQFAQMNPCECALACFLTDQEGTEVRVLPKEAYSDDEEIQLPKWAQKFITDFDTMDGATTGAKALRLL
jgi:hypothetical protein